MSTKSSSHRPTSSIITDKSSSSSSSTSSCANTSNIDAAVFLPDHIIAQHWIFRIIVWLINWLIKPIHGYKGKNNVNLC